MTQDEILTKVQALRDLRDSGKLPPDQQKTVEGACEAVSHLGQLLLNTIKAKEQTEFDRIRGKIVDALLR